MANLLLTLAVLIVEWYVEKKREEKDVDKILLQRAKKALDWKLSAIASSSGGQLRSEGGAIRLPSSGSSVEGDPD